MKLQLKLYIKLQRSGAMGCGVMGAWSRGEYPAWPQGQVGLGLQERASLCGPAFFLFIVNIIILIF